MNKIDIDGELNGQAPVIFITYFKRFAPYLLKNIRLNAPEFHAHLHIVNADDTK